MIGPQPVRFQSVNKDASARLDRSRLRSSDFWLRPPRMLGLNLGPARETGSQVSHAANGGLSLRASATPTSRSQVAQADKNERKSSF